MVGPVLSDHCLSCLPVLCVTFVFIVAKWLDGLGFRMSLGMVAGLGSGHIMLCGTQLPSKGAQPPNFWHISVVAMRINMPFGTEVGLCPGDIVLDGDTGCPQKAL